MIKSYTVNKKASTGCMTDLPDYRILGVIYKSIGCTLDLMNQQHPREEIGNTYFYQASQVSFMIRQIYESLL